MSDTDTTPDGSGGSDMLAPDQVTTVTSTGWLGRLGGSVTGALIGVGLVIGAVVLLGWNESKEVAALRTLALAARLVVEAPPGHIDPALEGRLVHLSGALAAAAPARDPMFGVASADALRLERRVEMFQWQENASSSTEKSLGGGSTTTTTYNYQKVWADRAIDSGPFHARAGHVNPPLPVSHLTSDAAEVRLGPYRVDQRCWTG